MSKSKYDQYIAVPQAEETTGFSTPEPPVITKANWWTVAVILLLLLLVIGGSATYLIVTNKDSIDEFFNSLDTEDPNTNEEIEIQLDEDNTENNVETIVNEEVTVNIIEEESTQVIVDDNTLLGMTLSSSTTAIQATYDEAYEWSTDVQLSSCEARVMSNYIYNGEKYEQAGFKDGTYNSWLCRYYSPSKQQLFSSRYSNGDIFYTSDSDVEDYAKFIYENSGAPSDPTTIVDSTTIFNNAINNGMDIENNYANMSLAKTNDYGFVWMLEEREKEEDSISIDNLVNIYIFNPISGKLIKITDKYLF